MPYKLVALSNMQANRIYGQWAISIQINEASKFPFSHIVRLKAYSAHNNVTWDSNTTQKDMTRLYQYTCIHTLFNVSLWFAFNELPFLS